MSQTVKDFVKISPFRLYIDFSIFGTTTEKISALKDYVITDGLSKRLKTVLDALRDIKREGKKTFLIVGSYGTGKSYFLIFVALILESLLNPEIAKLVNSKLSDNTTLLDRFRLLKERTMRLLPVKIDLKQESKSEWMRGILIAHIKRAIKEYLGRDVTLPYEWDKILGGIEQMANFDKDRLNKILKKKGHSLDEIKELIGMRKYEGIKMFREAYESEFKFTPNFVALRMDEILDQVLREVSHDVDGIVFLIDELQKYLVGSDLSKVEDDLFTLEALSEAAERKPIIILPTVLETQIALKGDPWGKTYEKYTSRFESFSLYLEELDKIIQSKLEIAKRLPETLRDNNRISILDNENRETLYRLYPINPVTFRLLRQVTQIRAAERTAFMFLSDAFTRIMNENFIRADGEPSLITPDFLYDYFKPDLMNQNKEIVEEVESLLSVTTDDQEKCYLKYMAVATLFENQFSKKDLSQAFLDDEKVAHKLMMKIIGSRVRVFSSIKLDNIYAIKPLGGSVVYVLDELMKDVKDPLGSLIVMLNDHNKNKDKWKVDGATRLIEISFCLFREAKELLRQQTTKELRLLVVLHDAGIDLKGPEVQELLELAGDSTVLVFVVKQRIADLAILREYFAARRALSQGRLSKEDVENIMGNTIVHFKNLFATDNISVWYRAKQIPKQSDLLSVDEDLIMNENFLNEVLREAFKKLYPIYSDLRAKFHPDVDLSSKRITNDVITGFFAQEPITIDFKKSSLAKHVKDLVEPAGFAVIKDDQYHFATPSKGIQNKVLEMIRQKIKEESRSPLLYNFFEKLGFPESLIEMYLAALVKSKEITIIDKNKKYVRFDSMKPSEFLTTIQELVRNSKKGITYYIRVAKQFPKENWLVLRKFLIEIAGPFPILQQETLAEEQVPEALEPISSHVPRYLEKLSDLRDYLKRYNDKASRISTRIKKVRAPLNMRQIDALKECLDHINSLLQSREPFDALNESANELFTLTGKTGPGDALFDIEQIFQLIGPLVKFLDSKESKELTTCIDYLEDARVTNEFQDLKQKQDELLTSVVEKSQAFITSEEEYKTFMSKFHIFKTLYVDTYSQQHDIERFDVEEFYRNYKQSCYLKLIEQLESVGRKVVTKSASNMMEQLNGLYRMVCHLEKEKVQSFLEDKTTCVCGYGLLNKGIRTVIKSTQEQVSSDFTQHCIDSLRNLHLTLHNNKDRYEELSKEQGVEQQAENLFRAVEEIITDSRKAAKEQIDQVTDLIVNMRSMLSETLEAPELKKPKPEAITFSRILSEFRREVGEKATVTEFVEWIKRRYKEQEEIVIDIP